MGRTQGNMCPQAGGQGTGPSLPRESGLRWCHYSLPSRGPELLTLTGYWRVAPGLGARPGSPSQWPIPRLLVCICSLFRSATHRPRPSHACQDSWAFAASPHGGGSCRWAGLGRERAWRERGQATAPGHAKQTWAAPRSRGEIVQK